ncbi:hypothetical protein N7510_009735 [Penicillium lagena]|uniref:uncharacterized protein n=1 Tax=Penicillium lagena TaxID=94218 RepID=UPI002541797B|nr:uncharacterized protein N7510_009735 [Penicillium lagena]KAJ5604581.1 hypothetical protein N7510_009735 [Penicillium lagena]
MTTQAHRTSRQGPLAPAQNIKESSSHRTIVSPAILSNGRTRYVDPDAESASGAHREYYLRIRCAEWVSGGSPGF